MTLIVPEFNESEINELIELVYKHTGITLGENPRQMLQMRLRGRFRELKCHNIEEYKIYLKSHQDEKQLFINAVTTNETYFFRTQRVWEYLEKVFIPNWVEKNPSKTLSVWSAASSSGEEAYSIAILLEKAKLRYPGLKYKIVGTDISEKVLKKASLGIYSGRPVEMLLRDQPETLQSYFVSKGSGEYQVRPDIRQNVSFKNHNLFNPLESTEKFELILLRNVLIYFNEMDQLKTINQVTKNAASSALLVIGESESISHLKTECRYLSPLFYEVKAA